MTLHTPPELRTPQQVYLDWLETSRTEFACGLCDDIVHLLNGNMIVAAEGEFVSFQSWQSMLDVGAQA